MHQIGVWLSKVSDQPASVWWAGDETALHPDIQQQIRLSLKRSQKNSSPATRQAWRYLFEGWEEKQRDFYRDWYELKPMIDKDG
ncbi:MAG: hypothetical protein L0312_32230 [Acidobacteria bacterium]|nr:hypothetical protein [Acidobacteriota bacterium]